MARAVYQCEMNDPDFTWLLSSFRENHPEYYLVESSTYPLVLVKGEHLVLSSEAEEHTEVNPSVPSANDSSVIQNLLKGQGK